MSSISTTVLIISDTHGKLVENLPDFPVDVVIHCGDITDGSQLREYETALQMLISIDAAVKIVIPGNHDWTLDGCAYERMLQDALQHDITIEEFEAAYGRPTIFGEAYDLLTSQRAREAGVLLLESDMRSIKLESGAELRVATSPETPSAYGNMGFVYSPRYPPSWHFANSNSQDIDILITHGPPRGIMDMTEGSGRIGCPSLFEAVAQVKPRIHCFGHVHRCWGARLVQWRDETPEAVSHITAIDNHNCKTIANLAFPDDEQPHPVEIDEHIERGKQTLFVNAAIEAPPNEPQHKPFIVTLDLAMR